MEPTQRSRGLISHKERSLSPQNVLIQLSLMAISRHRRKKSIRGFLPLRPSLSLSLSLERASDPRDLYFNKG